MSAADTSHCTKTTRLGAPCSNAVMRDGLCFSHHPSNRSSFAGRLARRAENDAAAVAAQRAEAVAAARAAADKAAAEYEDWKAKKEPADKGVLRFLSELTGGKAR